MLAVKFDDVDSVRKFCAEADDDLLHHKMNEGKSWLHLAVEHKALASLQVLLDKGLNIESRDDDDWTPIMYCVFNSFVPCLKELLCRGARVDGSTALGSTLWHVAAFRNSDDILRVLIEHSGAAKIQALSRQTKDGCTL